MHLLLSLKYIYSTFNGMSLVLHRSLQVRSYRCVLQNVPQQTALITLYSSNDSVVHCFPLPRTREFRLQRE